MSGPGPLEEALLAELARGPRLAIELAEAARRSVPLVAGMLRDLRDRGLVVDEDAGDPPVRRWRLAGGPRRAA